MSPKASFDIGTRISISLIISVILFSPFFFSHLKIPSVTLAEPLVFAALFVFILKDIKRGTLALRRDGEDIFAVSFLLFIILQLFFGRAIFTDAVKFGTVYAYRTWWGLIRVFSYFALFWVIKNYINKEDQIYRLIVGAVIACTILSIIGIFQKTLAPASKGFSLYLNRNHFAGYAEMVFPLALSALLYKFYIFRSEERHIVRRLGRFFSDVIHNFESGTIFFLLATFIMGFAIFMSLSRTGIAVFLISFLFFLSLIFKEGIKAGGAIYNRRRLILLLFLLAAIIVTMALWVWSGPITARFMAAREDLKSRLGIYVGIIKLIKDYPLFGTGFNTFEYAFARYQPNSSTKRMNYGDNDYLQLISEVGIVGAVLLFLYFYILLKKGFKIVLGTQNLFAKYIGYGCLTSVFAISLHSLVDFNLRIHSNAIIFSAVIGALGSIAGDSKPDISKKTTVELPHFFKTVFHLSLTVLLSFLIVISLFENVSFLLSKRNNAKSLRAASRMSPLNAEYHYLLSRLEPDLETAKKALDMNPLNHTYSLNIARIYTRLGMYDDADRYYKRYIELDPQDGYAYLQYAIYLFNRREIPRGIAIYKKAVELHPPLSDLRPYEKYIMNYDEVINSGFFD